MSKKLTVRVYGDSISLPRCGDGVSVEMSWPVLAADMLGPDFVVINRSVGGATIKEMSRLCLQDQCYFKSSCDVVVIWLGIVDCAPRPVPPFVRDVISHFPACVRGKIVGFLHTHRTAILRRKHWTNTSLKFFRERYGKMLRSLTADGCESVCVSIGPITRDIAIRCPGFDHEISRYNNAIRELVANNPKAHFLELGECIRNAQDGGLLNDGHHHTGQGNVASAEAIVSYIKANILKHE